MGVGAGSCRSQNSRVLGSFEASLNKSLLATPKHLSIMPHCSDSMNLNLLKPSIVVLAASSSLWLFFAQKADESSMALSVPATTKIVR